MNGDITKSPLWEVLLHHVDAAAKGDSRNAPHLEWIQKRAAHYAERLGIPAVEIFETWEKNRTYWFLNYYQDANQPLLNNVRVFQTVEDLRASVGDKGFRCPACGGVSSDSQTCNTGLKVFHGKAKKQTEKVCDWKSFGLFGTMGKGADYLVVKTPMGSMHQGHIFMPVAWETQG